MSIAPVTGRAFRHLLALAASAFAVLLPVTVQGASATAATAQQGAQITSLRFAHHADFDRIVWTFTGPLPHRDVHYVKRVTADPSGKVIKLEGKARLRVVFYSTSTSAAQPQGTWTPNLPEVRQVKGAGNFEGYTSYGVGLASRQPFHVHTLTNPNRVIIDVQLPPS